MNNIHDLNLMLDAMKRIVNERKETSTHHEASELNYNELYDSFYEQIKENARNLYLHTCNKTHYDQVVHDFVNNDISKDKFVNEIFQSG